MRSTKKKNRSLRLAVEGLEVRRVMDNTFATAVNLGTVATSATRTGSVGAADVIDTYKFAVSAISDVNVTLSTGEVYQKLVVDRNNNGLTDSGEVLAERWGSTLNQRLPAGNYYVTAERGDGSFNYSLTVSRVAAPADVPNTLLTGRALTFDTNGVSTTDEWLGSADAIDAYKFSVASISNVNVTLSTGEVYQKLIVDRNSNGLIDSGEVLAERWGGTLNQRLPAGNYYITAERGDGSFNYSLTVNRVTAPADVPNTLLTGRSLTFDTNGVSTTDEWLGSADGIDAYKFTVGSISDVNVTLSTGEVYQKLIVDRNSNGLIDSGEVLAERWGGTLNQRLPAGNYYITAERGDGSFDYSLTVNRVAAPADAGDTLLTARDFGVVSGVKVQEEWVGSADPLDCYKFNVPAGGQISSTLSTGEVYQRVIRDTNGNGRVDSGEILAERWGGVSTLTVAAGTYYIQAERGDGSFPYSLTINAPVVANPTPSAPSTLTASVVSASQINLSWKDNSTNETSFRVERATNSTFTAGLVTTSVAANVKALSVTGLAASTTYYFRVRAANGSNLSAYSNTASATTQAATSTFAVRNATTGIVTVTGTSAADRIRVIYAGSGTTATLSFLLNSLPAISFTASSVNGIVVNAGAGDDYVAITSAFTKPSTINGGTGNDYMIAGMGAGNRINGDAGTDTGVRRLATDVFATTEEII